MKKTIGILALSLLLVCAVFFGLAQARRMGGGASFGSRPSYSGGYGKSVSPSPSSVPPSAPSATPLQSPGMGSRMGWGLGGLMAGGLLGSMLFGGGMGGGGGIGLLDILLLGVIAYFVVKLLRGRASGGGTPGQGGLRPPTQPPQPPQQSDPRSQAERSWDALRSTPAQQGSTGGFGDAPPRAEEISAPVVVPQGFDVPEFLEGSKTVYARLQHSWDRRDLADIALFTTPEVLAEIRRQAAADPTPSKTELVLVNARLLEFKEEAADTVLFDVLLREDVNEERPKQIREVWHFSRPTANLEANWRLEGIQQLEG